MIIEVIGVGGGFSYELGNSSVLAWDDSNKSAVLFDCGNTTFAALREKEQKEKRDIISKIDSVFISHLHDDHYGSAATLLEYRFWVHHKPTNVTASVPFAEMFRGRMDNYNAKEIYAGPDKRIKKIPTKHAADFPCFGAYFDGLLFSGDTGVSMLKSKYAEKAKIIIHEVRLNQITVHIGIDQLAASAPAEILNKTYCIHYSSNEKKELQAKIKQFGLAGLLKPNQIIKTR
ncbi:MAG: MBL fold metallo-hydrolase [Rickettsiales bacterium]|jgi:ribonuclease BN (tRNA processing enzyme)|nr:MBL fold metallo-hydrolase [Rickettsiales bacterium]